MWDRICVPLCLLPNERSTNPLLGELCNLLQTGGKCLKSGFRFNSVFHHHNLKSQPLSVGIFFARNASVGAVSRLGLLSTPLPKSPFRARIPPVFSLCSLLPSSAFKARSRVAARVCGASVCIFVCSGACDRDSEGTKNRPAAA